MLDALDGVERICGTGRTAVMGVCAGGIIASVMAAHLAAVGQQDRLACFSLLVTVLDTANAGTVAALTDRQPGHHGPCSHSPPRAATTSPVTTSASPPVPTAAPHVATRTRRG